MSNFTDPLEVRKLKDDKWQLLRHLQYHAGTKESGEVYTVAKGYISDGATIPRAFWGIVGHPMDDYAAAAFLHDMFYSTGIVTKAKADNLFLEAMGVLGVAWWKRKAMYWAVRLFAGSVWNNYRKSQKVGFNG